jgi:hypothetical protein
MSRRIVISRDVRFHEDWLYKDFKSGKTDPSQLAISATNGATTPPIPFLESTDHELSNGSNRMSLRGHSSSLSFNDHSHSDGTTNDTDHSNEGESEHEHHADHSNDVVEDEGALSEYPEFLKIDYQDYFTLGD